ncbi:hypothetical protein ACOSQ2_021551 [Xanthoceras sorbifolium]
MRSGKELRCNDQASQRSDTSQWELRLAVVIRERSLTKPVEVEDLELRCNFSRFSRDSHKLLV